MIWLLFLISVLGALGIWLYKRWQGKNTKSIALAAQLPGPNTIPLLGNATHLAVKESAFIKVIQDWIDEYGDLVRLWTGPVLNVVVSHPDYVRALLSSPKTSVRGVNYMFIADILGGGILSGSGAISQELAFPTYGKRAVEAYTQVFNREADLMVEALKSLSSEPMDIYKPIVQCTSYSVCQTLLGLTKEETTELPHLKYLINKTTRMYQVIFERITHWYQHIDPVFWLSGDAAFLNKYIRRIALFGDAIAGHRRRKLQSLSQEKLDSLLRVDDDSIEDARLSIVDRFLLSMQLNTFDLRNEIFTIFSTSQEPSAKLSSFLMLMMAYHPKCQAKLVAEINRVVGLQPSNISDEELCNMPYLEMVFQEVLRLFPICALIQREVIEDFELTKDVTLPAGSAFIIPIFHIHRDPRFWLSPNYFNPERFTPENTRHRHPFCYLPFSLGKVDCLVRHFCAKLVKTISIKILREFHVSSLECYEDLKLKIEVSVTSVKRFHVILTPRKSKDECTEETL